MNLLVQIPCLNEESTLPSVINSIPQAIDGIEAVGILVVDDGSQDNTAAVARSLGCQVVSHEQNEGLAQAFSTGIRTALSGGADIIVNIDADNQYEAEDIPVLIRPILEGEAHWVVGVRPIMSNPDFNILKKILQKVGTFAVRVLSGRNIGDAPSGFRAYSREVAEVLEVETRFSYTMETIFQLSSTQFRVATVPIRINRSTRPSRLARSMPRYIGKSASTILSAAWKYQRLRLVGLCALPLAITFLISVAR